MNSLKIDFTKIEESPSSKEPSCIGLFYRARISYFIDSNNNYAHQERMIPLLRKSCKGCSQCGNLKDMLEESLPYSPPLLKNIKDGGTYQLQITNVSQDWETGLADDWDIEFVEQKESLSEPTTTQ